MIPSFPPRIEEPAQSTTAARGFARLDELLSPLHGLCRDQRLTPLNNRRAVAEALAPYDDETIATAVRDIVGDATSGRAAVTSPFGLLVARARRGDLTSTAPAEVPPVAIHPDPVEQAEDGLLGLIASYEADPIHAQLLRELDADIQAEMPLLLARGIPEPMRRALRADALRNRRPASAAC